ncbi:maleylpyruvate isomerase family mycothiol-dependent enzyme [Nonomuraea typhae]|uniref:maleylpyruvate isomerase family mycothiol-dependent enzyme n=1 Tax=Nonomuraea typhae TaxID=2603600 RepID=UPI0012F8E52F|nr:maleylpyruvate isomerase family mycothiol-dependent enzyme [Nonomuraea typhae]
MDYVTHFHREVQAFEAAARRVAGEEAPDVPSCAGWTMSDLVLHLSGVHRLVTALIEERRSEPVNPAELVGQLPSDTAGWPDPETAPTRGPLPPGLVDWFAEGAAVLEGVFATMDPALEVWTWSAERTAGFWSRMQVIEAAVHRWDAEYALGEPQDMDAELAADAVRQTFEVMVPSRRAWKPARPTAGETYRFVRTDGDEEWVVCFADEQVRLGGFPADVTVSGTASELMLFLWQRIPADRLTVSGDTQVLDRYFELAPPI